MKQEQLSTQALSGIEYETFDSIEYDDVIDVLLTISYDGTPVNQRKN